MELETDESATSVVENYPHAPAAAVTVTLDIAVGASGTVTSSPSGFNCTGSDATCTASFEAGTSVTLTATPGSGNTFLGWGGACTGTSTCLITATAGHLVVAAFGNASTAAISYYHTDVLGSVRAITSSIGSTVTRHDYAPFGESTSALTGDPRRFIGQELDAETALDHFGARYHRNVWGRFTSVDPFLSPSALANPQQWNRYTYALNSPMTWSDPSGLSTCATTCTSTSVTVTGSMPGVVSLRDMDSLRFGLWSDDAEDDWLTEDHHEIIDTVFAFLKPEERSILKEASDFQDKFPNVLKNNLHGQLDPGQDPKKGYGEMNKSVAKNIDVAIKAQQEHMSKGLPGYSRDALFAIGLAIHTATDFFSPPHLAMPVYDLNPVNMAIHYAWERFYAPSDATAKASASTAALSVWNDFYRFVRR